MANRKWDSLHPDTLYGDAAGRVLCRLFGAEPTGRTLQECLDRKHVKSSAQAAIENAIRGDGVKIVDGMFAGVECKASTNGSANVCWNDNELSISKAKFLCAWVPGTDEIWWHCTVDEAKDIKHWLTFNDTWLICRDRLRMPTKEMIVAFTGHRPERIAGKVNEIYSAIHGLLFDGTYTHVISGMAQGVDQLAAGFAGRMFNIPWTAAIPFDGQHKRWPRQHQEIYESLLKTSSKMVVLSKEYHGGVYHIRDRWMVDNCDVLAAVWDGTKTGGTWATVKYAKEVGRKIKYLDFNTWQWNDENPYE